jgi:soluble lytic murein transglycosylase-like protein
MSAAMLAGTWHLRDRVYAVEQRWQERVLPQPTGPAVAAPTSLQVWDVSPQYLAVRDHMEEVVKLTGVDPQLLQAMIMAESRFHSQALSHRGAIGLMQVRPDTARLYGLRDDRFGSVESKLRDPYTNLLTGARILRSLRDQFPYRYDLVLAAYNAGPGSVARYGNKVPPFAETRRYVESIAQTYAQLKLQAAGEAIAP